MVCPAASARPRSEIPRVRRGTCTLYGKWNEAADPNHNLNPICRPWKRFLPLRLGRVVKIHRGILLLYPNETKYYTNKVSKLTKSQQEGPQQGGSHECRG